LPAANEVQLTEGGKLLAKARGLKFLRVEGDRAVLAVESGDYKFKSRF